MTLKIAGCSVLSMAAGIACMGLAAVSSAQADVEIRIENFAFVPQLITVKAGDTVTWVNHDDTPHVVTSESMRFRSKALDTDDKFSYTFTQPGTYAYFCSLHPMMTGSIVVDAGPGK